MQPETLRKASNLIMVIWCLCPPLGIHKDIHLEGRLDPLCGPWTQHFGPWRPVHRSPRHRYLCQLQLLDLHKWQPLLCVSSRVMLLIFCNLMLHSELPLKRNCSCEHTLAVAVYEFLLSPLRVPPQRIEVRPRSQLIGRVMLSESAMILWLDDLRGWPGSK